MHFSKALVLAAASTASATLIPVSVGNGGLKFDPATITAAIGDQVIFTFHAKNHSVTQSSFADPCHPLAGGFFSTFQPTTNIAANTFTIDVKDLKPIWLYCGQTTGNHCQSGMTAAINAPLTGNTFEKFQALAKNATTSTSPPGGVFGGVLAPLASNSSSSSGSSSSSVIESPTTVTTIVLSTVTATITSSESTFTTTYASSFMTTYTTTASSTVAVQSSTSSTAAQQTTTSGGERQAVVGVAGVAGAAMAFALGML